MYYIDFAAGDLDEYQQQLAAYRKLEAWVQEKGGAYGLPDAVDELDDVAKETVASIYGVEAGVSYTEADDRCSIGLTQLRFVPHLTMARSSSRYKTGHRQLPFAYHACTWM
jgi:hypothetical protein